MFPVYFDKSSPVGNIQETLQSSRKNEMTNSCRNPAANGRITAALYSPETLLFFRFWYSSLLEAE
jgi:hypothetical protein